MSEIELKNISKKFKNRLIFEELNLKVEKGSTVGIIGSNGVGKSILFKIICGLETPSSGTVKVKQEVLGKKVDYPLSVGILINEPTFINSYSGLKNLMLLAEINQIIGEEEIRKYMSLVGLDPDDRTRFARYSLGMKKKLAICQAIMEQQEIILLDEPFNGLDFLAIKEIKQLLVYMKSEGRTILLTGHNQQDLDELCDEFYLINEHKLFPLTQELREKYFN